MPESKNKNSVMSRRGVLKRATAVGVGSAATIGGAHRMGASPVGSAAAVAPLALAAGAAGAAGLAYLVYKKAENYLGHNNEDLSGYTGADALMTRIHSQARNMKSANERVMTSIENNLTNSESVAYVKGKSAALTEMNAGSEQSAAVTALESAIDQYYGTIQENILLHAKAQMDQTVHFFEMVDAHQNLSAVNRFNTYDFSYNITGWSLNPTTVSTLDGTEIEIQQIKTPNDGSGANYTNGWGQYTRFQVLSYNNLDRVTFNDGRTWLDAFDAAASRAQTVKDKLSAFVSDLYTEYGAGDIPTEDVLDPVTAATELKQNTGLASQAAAAGMMGIPTSAGFSLRLRLTDSSGSNYEVDAEIYTNAQPNDSDGNPAGFKVGKTYDPANFEAPIYVSYEYVDPETGETTSDFTEVQNPFTVLEATDSDGNEVQEVTPTSKTQQTTDITKLEEELASIREEQRRLLEKQQDPPAAGGAGSGFFEGSNLNLTQVGIGLGALGVVYALLGGGSS